MGLLGSWVNCTGCGNRFLASNWHSDESCPKCGTLAWPSAKKGGWKPADPAKVCPRCGYADATTKHKDTDGEPCPFVVQVEAKP